ncbi:MAG: DUF4912 domain-containing protein, partial [Planctomycetia bacterium]
LGPATSQIRRPAPALPPAVAAIARPPMVHPDADFVVAVPREPFWLQATWSFGPRVFARAEAALGAEWYTAKPMLRLVDATPSESGARTEQVVRTIEIHGGAHCWYIDVPRAAAVYRIEVGYVTRQGRFLTLGRSNPVQPAGVGSAPIETGWSATDAKLPPARRQVRRKPPHAVVSQPAVADVPPPVEHVDEGARPAFHRPLHSSTLGESSDGAGATPQFMFQVDAELIVYGRTRPDAVVELYGKPVPLRPDGTFTMRCALPDGRHLVSLSARRSIDADEHPIVLSIERNTKRLDPVERDEEDFW